jgi:hypothetical protein
MFWKHARSVLPLVIAVILLSLVFGVLGTGSDSAEAKPEGRPLASPGMGVSWWNPEMDSSTQVQECHGNDFEDAFGNFFIEGTYGKVIKSVWCNIPDTFETTAATFEVITSTYDAYYAGVSNNAYVVWADVYPATEYWFTDRVYYDASSVVDVTLYESVSGCTIFYSDESSEYVSPNTGSDNFNMKFDDDYCDPGSVSWSVEHDYGTAWPVHGCTDEPVRLTEGWDFTPMENHLFEDIICGTAPKCVNDIDCTLEYSTYADGLGLGDAVIEWNDLGGMGAFVDDVGLIMTGTVDLVYAITDGLCVATYTDDTVEYGLTDHDPTINIVWKDIWCGVRYGDSLENVQVQNDVTFHSAGYDNSCWDMGTDDEHYLIGDQDGAVALFDYDYTHHNGYGNGEIIVNMGAVITTTVDGALKVKTKNPIPTKTALFYQSGKVYTWNAGTSTWDDKGPGTWWATNDWGPEFDLGAVSTQFIKLKFEGPWDGDEIDAMSGIDAVRVTDVVE